MPPSPSRHTSLHLSQAGFALVAFTAALLAGWLAYAQWPAEASHPVLVLLEEGQSVSGPRLEETRTALARGGARVGFNGRNHVVQAQLALAGLRYLSPDAQGPAAETAAALFVDGLRHKPNARGAWRGLVASVFVAEGASDRLAQVVDGALLFDGGDPFTALTLVNVVLTYPDAFADAQMARVMALVPRLHNTWQMRRSLARVYVSLSPRGQQLLLQQLEDGENFALWAEQLHRTAG